MTATVNTHAALLGLVLVPQPERVRQTQELRRSSATSPHRVRRQGEGRGSRHQQRQAAARESLGH